MWVWHMHTIKSKETSSQLAIYVAMKLLATYSTSSRYNIGYYLCMFMQT